MSPLWCKAIILIFLYMKNKINHPKFDNYSNIFFYNFMLIKLAIIACSVTLGIKSYADNIKSNSSAPINDIPKLVTKTESSYSNVESNNLQDNIDPLEKYNRQIFKLNTSLDNNIVRPVAIGYVKHIPSPIRTAITNFFNNLQDFVTLGNDILQLKGRETMQTTMRISLNSTFGIAGLIDICSAMGLNMHKNHFGKTLQTYGWKNSSYFVIPILGPSTIRDCIGLIPDIYFNPAWVITDNNIIALGLFGVSNINQRSKYLDVDQLVYTSLDPYITMRDFYLQSNGQNSSPTNNQQININDLLNDSNDNSLNPTK